jgi:hypothetical protein
MTGVALAPELVTPSDLIPAAGEPWEGVFVRIEGAPLTVVNLPGFAEFEVNDGGPDDAVIDNFLYSVFDFPGTFPNFDVGAGFTAIQGPLNYTFGEFKIAPRLDSDLVGYTEAAAPYAACGAPGSVCPLTDFGCIVDDGMAPTQGACMPACMIDADCPSPASGTANPVCLDVNMDLANDACLLDCSGGETCPTGMSCFMTAFCLWPI